MGLLKRFQQTVGGTGIESVRFVQDENSTRGLVGALATERHHLLRIVDLDLRTVGRKETHIGVVAGKGSTAVIARATTDAGFAFADHRGAERDGCRTLTNPLRPVEKIGVRKAPRAERAFKKRARSGLADDCG